MTSRSVDQVADHDALLTRSFELAAMARAAGDHPFGALLAIDGTIVAEALNRLNSAPDITAHAETELVRILEREGRLHLLALGVVYASCEPCPMCVAAMFWAGARRIVFGLSAARLTDLATPPGESPVGFTITAAEIGRAARPPMEIDGPHREDEAAEAHIGFWY
jgi:tRNA(Arg) A34 adenosine deaminase TadA